MSRWRSCGRSAPDPHFFEKSPAFTIVSLAGSMCLRSAAPICAGVSAVTLFSNSLLQANVRPTKRLPAQAAASVPSCARFCAREEDGVLLVGGRHGFVGGRDVAELDRHALVGNGRLPAGEELLQERGHLRLVEVADDRDLRRARAVELLVEALHVLELLRLHV